MDYVIIGFLVALVLAFIVRDAWLTQKTMEYQDWLIALAVSKSLPQAALTKFVAHRDKPVTKEHLQTLLKMSSPDAPEAAEAPEAEGQEDNRFDAHGYPRSTLV